MSYHRNPLPHRHLRIGHRGADVKRLQVGTNLRLKRKGSRARCKVDGLYGPNTHTLFGRACYVIGLAHRKPTVAHQRLVRWPWQRTRTQVRTAEARRPKRPREGQLSPNFHVSEFDCRNGQKVPIYMYDDLKALCIKVLEPLRREFGPCVVNSGYRPQAYNASIGGEPNSFHRYELRKSQPAADTRYAKGGPRAWAAKARRLLGSAGGVGTYVRSGFIHTDTRIYRSDWSG